MKHALIAEQNAVFDALCHCYRAPTIELVANLVERNKSVTPESRRSRHPDPELATLLTVLPK
jgi:hypothetical protein